MKNVLIFVGFFATILATAQKDVDVKLYLRDGNILSGKTKISSTEFLSDYGKIIVPIKDLNEIELGIVPDTKQKSTVIAKLKTLEAADEKTAEKIFNEMIEMPIGVIPIIDEYLFSEAYNPDAYNSSFKPENIVSDLKSKYNVSSNYTMEDIVNFGNDFRIGGVYNFSSMSVTTEYGKLNIPREKIEKIESQYVDPDAKDKRFRLQASKNISSNADGGWLKTGFILKTGQHFSISATGEIVLASLSNEKYTPDGKIGVAPTEGTYPTYGNVVYKISDTGTTMKAGSNFSGVAEQGGMLYISIYETVYNASNTGSYSVKVKISK